jgi:hypothetical protein
MLCERAEWGKSTVARIAKERQDRTDKRRD